jgi:hypothetical protein
MQCIDLSQAALPSMACSDDEHCVSVFAGRIAKVVVNYAQRAKHSMLARKAWH